MAKARANPVDPAADTDETPFKGRPVGEPVPIWVEVPPGESAAGTFADWDVKGRTPAGAVLLKFTGDVMGRNKGRYVVENLPLDGGQYVKPLGDLGRVVPDEELEGWAFVVTLKVAPATFYVVASKAG